MKGFEPVTLKWRGESFRVEAEDQLRLIAEIEDALADKSGTPAVLVLMRKGGPSYARLSRAYGAALRYAGADVSDDEIYLSLTETIAEGDLALALQVQSAILGLLAIIAPPVHRRIMAPAEEAPEKPEGEGASEGAE
ncbi:hypothetical protein [Rhodovulum marinum]|uniref:Uncharacterized protein n=1 Tax=Rhodovulum marinum TaxID=320662 RepID=A0A4R2Q580_9RHOB|nr:hypothetical protein [Rhodovulum marinum]TCP43932.1 hypothetical protein EV662_10115 [Rhodovulum marinum]